MPSRRFQVEGTKSMWDDLIDSHAEAYLSTYPDIKEFCNFDKSGAWTNYYIGMVWTSNYERPLPQQLKIRGSKSLCDNGLVELDVSDIQEAEAFFPGRILAFIAVPTVKKQLKVTEILDPIAIAPRMKNSVPNTNVKLMIASGPYMDKDQEDWTLFDKIIEAAQERQPTHIVLIGPFVDSENKLIKSQYDKTWKLVTGKLVEGLHDLACKIYLMPTSRDIIPSHMAPTYYYPSSQIEFDLQLKDGAKPRCTIQSLPDPAQIDVDGLCLDVTSAEVLFHLNNCTSFINRNKTSQWDPLFRHLVTHGIYPVHPPPADMPIDYTALYKHLHLDRPGPNIIVVPTRFATPPVSEAAGRTIVTVPKCSAKKGFVFIEIRRDEGQKEGEEKGEGGMEVAESDLMSGDKFSQEFKFISLFQEN